MQIPAATRAKEMTNAAARALEAKPLKNIKRRMTDHTSLANMDTLNADAPQRSNTSMENVYSTNSDDANAVNNPKPRAPNAFNSLNFMPSKIALCVPLNAAPSTPR